MKKTLTAVAAVPPAKLLSLGDVAAEWGTSRAFVYDLVVRRQLRAIVMPSASSTRRGRILVDPRDLAEFLESRKTQVVS